MGKIYQTANTLASGHKIYQLSVICSKNPSDRSLFSFQRPEKFTQVVIFGLKIYHLATLDYLMIKMSKQVFT
jgi:hypothetical protein